MGVKGKKVFVLGGSGFVGSNLIESLLELGAEVVNADMREPEIKTRFIKADLNKSDLAFLDEPFDYLVELAAKSNERLCQENPVEAFETNTFLLFRVLQKIAGRKDIRKIIFLSSSIIYDDQAVGFPTGEEEKKNIQANLYGLTKGISEEICRWFIQEYGMPIIYFRPAHIFGPGQGFGKFPNLIPQVATQALREKEITLWNRKASRDFIFVDDIVDAIIKGLESDYVGTLNLGSGKATKISDIIEIISKESNSRVIDLNREVKGPLKIMLDSSKAEKVLGWKAKTGIGEGLKRTVAYYKKVLGGKK